LLKTALNLASNTPTHHHHIYVTQKEIFNKPLFVIEMIGITHTHTDGRMDRSTIHRIILLYIIERREKDMRKRFVNYIFSLRKIYATIVTRMQILKHGWCTKYDIQNFSKREKIPN
jgi:hypothetical protein